MSLFKRFSATVLSGIDQVVGEIENHDAVVQTTLKDMSNKIAAAKVNLSQMSREEDRLKLQIQEQREKVKRWQQRAIETAKKDEAKALECVSRSRLSQNQVDKLKKSLLRYQRSSEKLAADLSLSEQRLVELKQKQRLMRARQSTSSALKISSEANNDSMQLLDNTFDRWEVNISQVEMLNDDCTDIDPIESEFIQREQQDELKQELQLLLTKGEEK